MALSAEAKNKVIGGLQSHKKDTGSAAVQVGILTERINQLTDHLKGHKKDNHSRRGLIGMVSQRRKLLNYLMKNSREEYSKLIKKLKIRK